MSTLTLNDVEARLLGVLIEKELTTPEGYPLTQKALIAGSSQKSNRDPVLQMTEAEAFIGIQGLEAKDLILREPPGMGARVERWRHELRSRLSLDREETAVLAELLLRGPQAPGELRGRVNRMSSMETLAELSGVLDKLNKRGLVQRIAPASGSRAERWTQTLHGDRAGHVELPDAPPPGDPNTLAAIVAQHTGEPTAPATPAPTAPAPTAAPVATSPAAGSPEELEARVARLERQLARLAESLGERLAE